MGGGSHVFDIFTGRFLDIFRFFCIKLTRQFIHQYKTQRGKELFLIKGFEYICMFFCMKTTLCSRHIQTLAKNNAYPLSLSIITPLHLRRIELMDLKAFPFVFIINSNTSSLGLFSTEISCTNKMDKLHENLCENLEKVNLFSLTPRS